MKKILVILLLSYLASFAHASKLSKFINKQKAHAKERNQQELRQDMDFADFSFRKQKRYVNERGEQCREYSMRSRSNPYRHGLYTVCNER